MENLENMVGVAISNPSPKWISQFNLWMLGSRYKNGHQKYMSWKEFGLCVQPPSTIQDVLVNAISGGGGLYDLLINFKNLHFDNEYLNNHRNSEDCEENGHKNETLGLLITSH